MKTTVKMGHSKQEYEVDVEKGASIRVTTTIAAFHTLPQETHDVTFKIGDKAEYGSYNLSYYGAITSITEKTVTIKEDDGTGHRLSLAEFAWRNYNFQLERVARENSATMQAI